MRCVQKKFKIKVKFGSDEVNGIELGNGTFGVWSDKEGCYVTHIPSGYRIGSKFIELGNAFRFAKELAGMALIYDMSTTNAVRSMQQKISETRMAIDGVAIH